MRKSVLVVPVLMAMLAIAANAGEIVVNGDFESPILPSHVNTYGAGVAFNGWTVASGSIDVLTDYWQNADGRQSVDLNGMSAGSIYQDLATTPGQRYRLSFSLAGNPDGPPATKSLGVAWGGADVASLVFDVSGRSKYDMGWRSVILDLTATSAVTRLQFTSLDAGYYGPALDSVSVVPEPSAVMRWLSLAAVGAVVAWRWRRRKAA